MDVDKWPSEHVSKFDAARRQLRTAIRLFFEEADSVSIHTLTAASHELLRTLVKAEGGSSILKDSDLIKPEHRKEYEHIMNRPQNFFKHADRDPKEVIDFQPKTTPFWILDCIMMDARLAGRRFVLREFRVFMIWHMLEYPQFLKPEAEDLIPENFRQAVQQFGRTKQFFRIMIEKPDLCPMLDVD